jgi:small subunit ribosomal protein S10
LYIGAPPGTPPKAGPEYRAVALANFDNRFSGMNQKIRIKLRSYDHNLVDKSTEKIIRTVKNTGAVITGPIPLPSKREIFTVLRSPHVNKKSREQFQLRTHKRLIEIYSPTPKVVDALSKLELPSGVDIQLKLT